MLIVVIGGTGFIGQYVVKNLLLQGHEVITTGTCIEKAKKNRWFEDVSFLEIDLSGPIQEEKFKTIASADKVIHLAWAGLPNYNGMKHIEVNLFEQYYFLKKLIEFGLKDILITGTCLEYGLQNGCLAPSLPTNPIVPYAIAKDTLRKLMQHLQKENTFNFKWLRLFYMYGEGQHKSSLLSQLDYAISNNEKIFNMSNGDQLRDYMHVEQVAKKIISASLSSEKFLLANCCSSIPISVKELVENYLEQKKYQIELNLGFYDYPAYEPKSFWGSSFEVTSENSI
jgi:dTDP-6-deoxy-L-talose 4-dehydrogenase (NAD+)